MTSAVLDELTEITGISDGTPPCEVFMDLDGKERCGKPSDVRVQIACIFHGVHQQFVCQKHYDELCAMDLVCVVCHGPIVFKVI